MRISEKCQGAFVERNTFATGLHPDTDILADDYDVTMDISAVECITAEMLGRKSLFPGKNTTRHIAPTALRRRPWRRPWRRPKETP